jgi:hypothetical protein
MQQFVNVLLQKRDCGCIRFLYQHNSLQKFLFGSFYLIYRLNTGGRSPAGIQKIIS